MYYLDLDDHKLNAVYIFCCIYNLQTYQEIYIVVLLDKLLYHAVHWCCSQLYKYIKQYYLNKNIPTYKICFAKPKLVTYYRELYPQFEHYLLVYRKPLKTHFSMFWQIRECKTMRFLLVTKFQAYKFPIKQHFRIKKLFIFSNLLAFRAQGLHR